MPSSRNRGHNRGRAAETEAMLGHFTEFLNAEDPETQVEALIMAGSLERLAARCGIYQLEGAQEVNIELHHCGRPARTPLKLGMFGHPRYTQA
ncbi:hypothetical protein lerEdw1_000894 [Lerista edwardsae]|nr:hypothetical protein lerEdw1_000894 [Lerista edwardsae]